MTARPVAATLNNSCSSWAKNARSPSGSATYWKLPPPASAIALSSPSSKSCPTPTVVVAMPRRRSSPACRASIPGSRMPTLASPSVSRMTRRIRVAVASASLTGCRLGELMAAGDPAAGEVRRSPGIDAVQRQPQTRLEPGRRRRQRLHGIDLIVVDDQRRAVGVSQPRDGQINPLLGEIQFAALHRPGAVEDERDVEGRRAAGLSLVLGRGDDRTSSVASPPLAAISGFSHRASTRGVILRPCRLRSHGCRNLGLRWNRSS